MSSTTPRVDLRPDHWEIVRNVLRQHFPMRRVVAFGSRATWTAKEYSDLDLAILGEEPLPLDAVAAMAEGFRESDLPFKVDVVVWANINDHLRDIILLNAVDVQTPKAGPASTFAPSSAADRLHLSASHRRVLEGLLHEHLPDVEVWAYGSRVNGRCHDGSDLDLVMRGPGLENVPAQQLADFAGAVRDSTIPFLVEARDWARLPDVFRREIERDHAVLVRRLADDTRSATLGDYFTLQRGTTYKSRLLGQAGPVLLGLASIHRNGGFRPDKLRTYGGDCPQKLLVHPGELYVSLKDVTQSADLLGAVAKFPESRLPGRLTQDTVKLKPKHDDVPIHYIHWLLRTPQYRQYCHAHATGTTNLGLPKDDFLTYPVPPLTPARCRLVELLDALDDNIELNHRMNETLEAMARALFKSWFVDFDPVRAKIAGRDTGLPQSISALFPDLMAENGLPLGWQMSTLGDHVSNFDSRRVPVSRAQRAVMQGPFPYHGAAGVLDHVNDYLFDGTFLLLGEDGSVTRQNGLAVTQYVSGRFWANNHAHVLQGKGAVSTEQAYLHFAFEPISPFVTGAVQPKLSQRRMNQMPFVYAGEAACRAFAQATRGMFARLRANARESDTLAAVRDALLPKLVSGEIRVPQAEKAPAEIL